MVKVKICSSCKTAFNCGATQAHGTCWCAAMPNIMPLTNTTDCFCPGCLKLKIREMEAHTPTDLVLKPKEQL